MICQLAAQPKCKHVALVVLKYDIVQSHAMHIYMVTLVYACVNDSGF